MIQNLSGPQIEQFRREMHLSRVELAKLMMARGRWTNKRRVQDMEEQTCKVYDRDLAVLSVILNQPVEAFLGGEEVLDAFLRQICPIDPSEVEEDDAP